LERDGAAGASHTARPARSAAVRRPGLRV